MGWDFAYQGKKALITRLVRPYTGIGTGAEYECVKHTLRGSHHWSVWEKTPIEGKSYRFIRLDLIKVCRDGATGYKTMEESAGPRYYDCPLGYLKMVPRVTCQEWRNKVHEYHAAKKAHRAKLDSIEVGQVWSLKGSTIPHVRIVSLNPRRGAYGGQRYRIPPRMVGDLIQERASDD